MCRNPLVAAERARKREDLLARDRARAGRDRPACRARHAARRRPDRARRRPGAQALQGQKALRSPDHRHHLHLPAQDRADRDRGGAGRDLRAAHQRRRTPSFHRRGRALLQEPRTGRARVQAPSRAPSSRSARSTTTSKTASARTCSSACSPTTSPGTCATPGRRCSSKTNTHPSSPTRSPKPPAPPPRSAKPSTKRTSTGEPCHSYKSLLAELATLTRNTIRLPGTTATFHKLAQPTTLQARALDLAEHAPLDP